MTHMSRLQSLTRYAHTCRFQMRSIAWPACLQMQVTTCSPLACSARRQQHGSGLASSAFPRFSQGHDEAVAATLEALGQKEFDASWAEGAVLSTEEAIGYAQRGRGERKRPTSGWGSMTPTECDVVRLVAEGLGNKDIAERLFISPRTVQTHLTHVYAKLNLSSRIQLVQEVARHT